MLRRKRDLDLFRVLGDLVLHPDGQQTEFEGKVQIVLSKAFVTVHGNSSRPETVLEIATQRRKSAHRPSNSQAPQASSRTSNVSGACFNERSNVHPGILHLARSG